MDSIAVLVVMLVLLVGIFLLAPWLGICAAAMVAWFLGLVLRAPEIDP